MRVHVRATMGTLGLLARLRPYAHTTLINPREKKRERHVRFDEREPAIYVFERPLAIRDVPVGTVVTEDRDGALVPCAHQPAAGLTTHEVPAPGQTQGIALPQAAWQQLAPLPDSGGGYDVPPPGSWETHVALGRAILGELEPERIGPLGLGVDINQANRGGLMPLHAAACNGSASVVQWLLDRGARTEVVDRMGWTPLHYASVMGEVGVLRVLLAAGANPTARTASGHTAFDVADTERLPEELVAPLRPAPLPPPVTRSPLPVVRAR